jgi:hypothetical protein
MEFTIRERRKAIPFEAQIPAESLRDILGMDFSKGAEILVQLFSKEESGTEVAIQSREVDSEKRRLIQPPLIAGEDLNLRPLGRNHQGSGFAVPDWSSA